MKVGALRTFPRNLIFFTLMLNFSLSTSKSSCNIYNIAISFIFFLYIFLGGFPVFSLLYFFIFCSIFCYIFFFSCFRLPAFAPAVRLTKFLHCGKMLKNSKFNQSQCFVLFLCFSPLFVALFFVTVCFRAMCLAALFYYFVVTSAIVSESGPQSFVLFVKLAS